MSGKVHGLKEAIQRTSKLVDEIQAVRTVRALKSAAYIIRLEAATMTPIATSNLINSQYDVIVINGTRITSRIGYSAKYAFFVHEAKGKLLGKGVPRWGKLKGLGNVWDATGRPKFLEEAGKNTRALVFRAIKKELTL